MEMERKYVILTVLLSMGLLGGIFVLVRQNGGIGSVSASLVNGLNGPGGEWVQIQPRVAADSQGEDTKQDGIVAAETKKENTAKAKPAPIQWCDPATAAIAPAPRVIINEVAWMGTAVSYSDEWIELKNLDAAVIDLSGWQLQNKSKKIKISFGSTDALPAAGVYLLERTDDAAVPAVTANKIYTGGLANSNEALYLFDNNCQIQDSVSASAKWPAGNNMTKQTMARLADLSWGNSVAPGGTPGQ